MTEPTTPDATEPAAGQRSPRVTEIRAIAETLWFLPPPGRMMIADKLHGLGLRAHPDLASMVLEREGPAELGAHAPQRVVKKSSVTEGLDALRQVNPVLAARIESARSDPETMARIDAAQTNTDKVALAKEMGFATPDEVPDELKAQIGLTPDAGNP